MYLSQIHVVSVNTGAEQAPGADPARQLAQHEPFMSQELDFTLIDPQAFHDTNFSVDAFLVSLTKDVIGPVGKAAGSFTTGKDALSANEQVQRVQRLLGVLER